MEVVMNSPFIESLDRLPTARFDDALCAFIDAGGDHESQLVQVLISAVEKGREWRRLAA